MSAKAILILLTGCAMLVAVALLRSPHPPATPCSEITADAIAPVRNEIQPATVGPRKMETITATDLPVAAPETPALNTTPGTEVALAQIEAHSAAGDTGSLRRIAEQLRHPQPEVRVAARQALRDAGDRTLLPDIQFALEATSDAEEKVELQELADYLELPSYTELQATSTALASSRVERQRVTAPLRASRGTGGASTEMTSPVLNTQSPAKLLAELQAENQRLKQENAELRAILNPLVAQ